MFDEEKDRDSNGLNYSNSKNVIEVCNSGIYETKNNEVQFKRYPNLIFDSVYDERIIEMFPAKYNIEKLIKLNNSDDTDYVCSACLLDLFGESEDDIALISCCYHVYHKKCIQLWSRTENSCCQCKIKFGVAAIYNKNGIVLEYVSVANLIQAIVIDEPDSKSVCYCCLQTGDYCSLMKCSVCDKRAHWYCKNFSECPLNWSCDDHYRNSSNPRNDRIGRNSTVYNVSYQNFTEVASRALRCQNRSSRITTRQNSIRPYDISRSNETLNMLHGTSAVYNALAQTKARTLITDEIQDRLDVKCDISDVLSGAYLNNRKRLLCQKHQNSHTEKKKILKSSLDKLYKIADKILQLSENDNGIPDDSIYYIYLNNKK